jgi:hypothetical protein
VVAIFPNATGLSSARRRQARWEHADARAERDPVPGGGGERVHRRDLGGADGLDRFPHHPVAAKRSDLHLEVWPPTRRAPRYLRLRLGCFHQLALTV